MDVPFSPPNLLLVPHKGKLHPPFRNWEGIDQGDSGGFGTGSCDFEQGFDGPGREIALGN